MSFDYTMSKAKRIKFSPPGSTKGFTDSGRFVDEVTLKFKDGKKLFVSKTFLSMASPVFEAMFTRDFKEKLKGEVKLEGKTYDDVLEFLQCINPAVLTPITTVNVLKVAPLAEEYQVEVIITRCKDILTKWIAKLTQSIGHAEGHDGSNIPIIKSLLDILCLTTELNYGVIKQAVIESFGRCWHGYLCGNKALYKYEYMSPSEDIKQMHTKNKATFSSLPETLKNDLLTQRLENIGNDR